MPTLALALICLLPLGRHDARLLGVAEKGVAYLYGTEVKRLEARELPRAAWYAPRSRWRAEKILAWVDEKVVPGSGCDAVLAFTAEDISTTKGSHVDWGVLGLANIGGPSGVVSTFRARRGARGERLARRTVNVVNHELGHVFGLDHHPEGDCIMHDAEGSVRTVDRESGLLCPASRAAVEQRLRTRLPSPDSFDWSAVLN